jgi:excisionase family DNA binding protein
MRRSVVFELNLATMTPTPELLNAAQAAKLLGIGEKTVRKYTSERRIPFIRLSGRCVRYDAAALAGWLLARTVKPIVKM